MNKHILIIAGLLIANQSFADIGATNGVANPATCDSGVLDTDYGLVAFQAEYTPETINLSWYDNNTLINVSSTNSDTCTYGTGINLPTNPTKTGYKFTGWKVRPEMDFSTISVSGYRGRYAKANNVCYDTDRNTVNCDNNFADLNNGEWKKQYESGTMYGSGLCSSTPGTTLGETGNPSTSTGPYCWCQATGYIPDGSTTKYKPTNHIWVFHSDRTSTDECLRFCSTGCYYNNSDFRRTLLGISGS